MDELDWFKGIGFGCVLLIFALASACTGPVPDAGTPLILPRAVFRVGDSEPYRVSLVVRNKGSGEGEVEVNVRLHEKNRKETYFAEKKVNLRSHESVHLIVSVSAPSGDYTAEVETAYPPG